MTAVRDDEPRGHRIVVVVEYDVTSLTSEQVDGLLFGALASCQDVSFKIETTPGVISGVLTRR